MNIPDSFCPQAHDELREEPMARPRSLAQILWFYICLLAIVPELHGQVPDAWQPVPKDDLALKDNPTDPGSSAMILERQVYTDDEKRIQTEWIPNGEKTRPGYCPEQQLFARRPSMINQARRSFVRGDSRHP